MSDSRRSDFPKICVVGCGYIGLPTAAMFAKSGCDVLAVDVERDIVDNLNKGMILIEEPGLGEVVKEQVTNGRLHAAVKPESADAFIVAVPTPFADDVLKSCDLTYVLEAVESVLSVLKKGDLVIIESTVAPRSTDDYIVPLIEDKGFAIGEDVFLAHCPEGVFPGKILKELVSNNRIVGGITPACTYKAADLYRIFVKGDILETQARTAEMAKCAENTFRDVNIALANEFVKVCEHLDINCLDMFALSNTHPRVNFCSPGPGVGGHCLAIDPYFIYAEAPEQAKIIRLARDTNCSMPAYVCEKVKAMLESRGLDRKTARIAALGITYKGNVDDCRESPSLIIIKQLRDDGWNVAVHDAHARPDYGVELSEALDGTDLALVLVDHDEYKGSALAPFVTRMRTPLVFDTRNIVSDIDGALVLNYGNFFEYC